MEFFFGETRFMPHGHCYFWEPYLLWSHAIADLTIAVAYFVISILLFDLYKRRNDLRYKWILGLFGVFILSCGISHVFDVINLWKPFYYLDSIIRIITAIASFITAIAFFFIKSKLLKIPTAKQWEEVNATLHDTIQELENKEKQLQNTNQELSKQIELLHLAQQLSKVGSFETNYEAGFTTGSPQLYEIFGLPPEEAEKPIRVGFFYEKVFPEDMPYIEEKLSESARTGQVPELAYRIVINDRIKHILVRSGYFIDKNGKSNACGCVMDVTERKETQLKLQKLNEELALSNQELASSNEELTAATEELSSTTEELRTNNDQLVRVNEELSLLKKELEDRVTERTVELEQTSMELQERNEELDQYVYKVSHDIRAPIASVSGLIYLMKEENNPPATQQFLVLMENRISKLDDFIRSVLNYSKILNTAAQLIPIDFDKIVEQCMDELTYYPDAGKLAVTLQNLTNKQYKGDELRLLIVFKNMISNAIKYRNKQEESYLRIIISEENGGFVIRFEDNGIGIEAQYVEKIFQMFFRASYLSDGSGLGLYIVKQAVERMKGKLTVTSKLHVGTTFTLHLPDYEGLVS